MSDDSDNVIPFPHGRMEPGLFAPGASRATEVRSVVSVATVGNELDPEPAENLFSFREAARVFGLPESRLRYWSRSGFLSPSGRVGRRRFYTFRDLISLRVAKTLLGEGVPLQRVRRSLDSLQKTLPAVERPLAELRIRAEGDQIVVGGEGSTFEAATGQLVIDFDVKDINNDVVSVLSRDAAKKDDRRQRAYELYLEGCQLDEEDDLSSAAERCYLRALELDPTLSNALTNLGNIRFRQGAASEAEALYRQALEVDPGQPEAHYNLGFLAFEGGEPEEAAFRFEQAIEEDPAFADAHFNLAMALEELGRSQQARPHWQTYLELDPGGPWAEVARRYLR